MSMILGIMQPYFFPYLGYFDLINYSDGWIVFDCVQYIRHGWINRNRILHPQNGYQYITVPLKKHNRDTLIKDIQNIPEYPIKILRCIQNYAHMKAPFYDQVYSLVSECLEESEPSLSRLNVSILAKVCRYLHIPFHYAYYSELLIHEKIKDKIQGPGDWALEISKEIGASEYVNPPGGKNLFDPIRFKEAGIKLTIRDREPIRYTTHRKHPFIPRLSIIDTMMWVSPEEIKRYLDNEKTQII